MNIKVQTCNKDLSGREKFKPGREMYGNSERPLDQGTGQQTPDD
jgi:hypothetical protein